MLRKIDIVRSWPRAQFAALVAERDALCRELIDIKRERDDYRDALRDLRVAMRELQAAVLARQHAEAELAGPYRERAIARARRAGAARSGPAAELS